MATDSTLLRALPCHWLLDEPADGAWNMAVDEALLEAAADGVATLRCYGWRESTLSLGYFQRAEDRNEHAASRDCPLVRRASGGGAILHDAELTYSFTVPVADRLAGDARRLSQEIHAALTTALAEWGVAARPWNFPPAIGPEPLLCFQRRAPGDLVVDNVKIVGSAQRRHRRAVLQHGSVLLAASRCAPELPGLFELTGQRIEPRELAVRFHAALAARLSLHWLAAPDPTELARRAQLIAEQKFASASWTLRR